ncbi:MAG: hypothetical protein IJS01_12285 [Lentisphaeria bacterium]|nr:hypothetical protein [Lentisphaeria bacterium]
MSEHDRVWRELCANAGLFRLDPAQFARLEEAFRTWDAVFFEACAARALEADFPLDDVRAKVKPGDFEKFLFLCITASYHRAEEIYRAHGWPREMLDDIRNDFRLWEKTGLRDFGFCGLSPRIFSWLAQCFTGEVKQFGRLQCNDIHFFELPLSLYRQSDGSVKALPAFQKGNPPHPDLTFRDKAISLHIPASGPLKAGDCLDSIRRMCRFSKEFHPDYDFRAVVCYSWLLDPQFREFLPESSNILKFQALGHNLVCPGRDQTNEVIWRLWGVPGRGKAPSELPVRTSMERGVAAHLARGGRFQEGLLVIFRDELASL